MSLTLLSTLLGFVGSLIPEIFGYFKAHQQNKHQLAMLDMQMKASKMNLDFKAMRDGLVADKAELELLYTTFESKSRAVNIMNSMVRPLTVYILFGLYISVKVGLVVAMMSIPGARLGEALVSMWTQEDHFLLITALSFYFGSRAFTKLRLGR